MLVDINLLPEKERERSTLLIAALVIIGAAILFWAALFILSLSMAKETAQIEIQIASLHASQELIREEIQPSTDVEERQKLAATVEWAEAYRFDTLPLLREMVGLLPERGFFKSFAFTAPHESTVVIQFDDKSDAAFYLTRVKSSDSVAAAMMESLVAEELGEDSEMDTLPRVEATFRIEFVDDRDIAGETNEPVEMDGQEEGADE